MPRYLIKGSYVQDVCIEIEAHNEQQAIERARNKFKFAINESGLLKNCGFPIWIDYDLNPNKDGNYIIPLSNMQIATKSDNPNFKPLNETIEMEKVCAKTSPFDNRKDK